MLAFVILLAPTFALSPSFLFLSCFEAGLQILDKQIGNLRFTLDILECELVILLNILPPPSTGIPTSQLLILYCCLH